MHLIHGLLRAIAQQVGERGVRALERRVDEPLLLRGGAVEHSIDHLVLGSRVAHADAQPPEIRSELCDHVAHAVVPAVAAALLEPHNAGRQVDLVVHHQHFRRQDAIERGQRLYGCATVVHIGLGLHQPQFVASHLHPRQLALVA